MNKLFSGMDTQLAPRGLLDRVGVDLGGVWKRFGQDLGTVWQGIWIALDLFRTQFAKAFDIVFKLVSLQKR